MKLVALLATLALVFGCAYGPVDEQEQALRYELLIDPAFSVEERGAVLSAMGQWATVTKGPLASGWRIVKQPPHDPGEVGHADADLRTIWIRPGLEPRMFRRAILHELGHAHGVWRHVDRGVMQAWMADPPDVDFSPEDLAECRREGVCR